jgi:hypothetical protein
MRDDSRSAAPSATLATPESQAARLARLAHDARLLEFALCGDSDEARELAARLETALEDALDAEGPEDLARASRVLESALRDVTRLGLQLSAELSDMEIDGVLGRARMPVLTAVLTVPAR